MRIRKAVAGAAVVVTVVTVANLAPARASAASGWRVVAAIRPASSQTELTRVAATSPANAWAAGVSCASSCASAQLVVDRWDGKLWRRVTLPRSLPALNYTLASIGASSPGNVWVFAADTHNNTVAVHWDGTSWTQPRLPGWFFPDGGAGSFGEGFLKVEAFGPKRVWVFDAFAPAAHPFAAFYNGTSWVKRPLPLSPLAVSAPSPTNMWVVAESGLSTGPAGPASLGASSQRLTERALHWTGRTWRTVRMPNPNLANGRQFIPFAAAAQGNRSLWVQGTITSAKAPLGPNQLLRWNGHHWTRIAMPVKGINLLGDMAPDGQGGVWLATLSNSSASRLAHYHRGRWTTQLPPRYAGARTVVLDLTWIPGTRSDLAAGTTGPPVPAPKSHAAGVIVKHSG